MPSLLTVYLMSWHPNEQSVLTCIKHIDNRIRFNGFMFIRTAFEGFRHRFSNVVAVYGSAI